MAQPTKNQWIGIVALAIFAVLIGLAIGLLSASLKKLNSHEVAVKYDNFQKYLFDGVSNEGLHTGPPGFYFITFPNVYKTISFDSLTCLNKDGVKIILNVAYQFKARPTSLKELVVQFRNYSGYLRIMKTVGSSVLHECCSKYNTSQYQSERGGFTELVRTLMKTKYDSFKTDVTDLQVNNIQRPSQYETAVKKKEAARENIKVAEGERPRKLTQAETKKREAETQAQITIDKAMSQARIIDTKALTDAAAILNEYEREAATYQQIAVDLGLNSEGLLSYIGTRAIGDAKNAVYMSLKSPAKTSYVP